MIEHRRKQLLAVYRKGVSNRERINELLNLSAASPADDLRSTLALAETPRIRLLRKSLLEDRVIREAYERRSPDGQVTGCLLFHLLNFGSTEDLLNFDYPCERALDSACRCVRQWDDGLIDPTTVLRILDETLAERRRLNALEDAAVRRSNVRVRVVDTP